MCLSALRTLKNTTFSAELLDAYGLGLHQTPRIAWEYKGVPSSVFEGNVSPKNRKCGPTLGPNPKTLNPKP